ncbi:MAG: hypothetical protein ACYDCF_08355, partial [Burkholderiales bacterium]
MDLAKERGNGAARAGLGVEIQPFGGGDLNVMMAAANQVCVDLSALYLKRNAFDLKGRRHLIKGEACRRAPPLL